MSSLTEKARVFRSLHVPGDPLLLPNAWDVASALLTEAAGAKAVATTSAGVAWSLGVPDGDNLGRDRAAEAVRRVTEVVGVPVTADIEGGFGATPDEVAVTITRILEAGAVGVNIEDGARSLADQAARLAAARQSADDFGVPLFINARIDTYLRGGDDLADTLRRASAFLEAGATGIFVPGVHDPGLAAQLVKEIDAPVNMLLGPGAPPVSAFAEAGVARISLGSSVASAAYAVAKAATEELLAGGTYTSIAAGLPYGELNNLLQKG
ncbi:isocitrate lyase/phosphoenolpyruvate mutase family protein [Herbidospora galbida]|uniref:Isocitrate lyase/phosphoenolpyruvate mutase family protein n=1 Tax=Herbidospora galbida TaxID=2575442 RepID=A0A4U3MBX9_9ACTN|nr:isocitrate lyase/phosphoenolpyruvate mutase family protein [Herbidospora galbida]TKK85126.1 isocitrate lyase/phosphoenolpyruvate mutase family protein [Herbidospora galbida]